MAKELEKELPEDEKFKGNLLVLTSGAVFKNINYVAGSTVKIINKEAEIIAPIANFIEGLSFKKVRKIKLSPDYEILASCGEYPLIARRETSEGKLVYLGFDPEQDVINSLSPAYPLLVAGLFEEMGLSPRFQSLFSAKPWESDNRLTLERQLESGSPPDLKILGARRTPLWPFFAFLAVMTLLLEWWLVRKKA